MSIRRRIMLGAAALAAVAVVPIVMPYVASAASVSSTEIVSKTITFNGMTTLATTVDCPAGKVPTHAGFKFDVSQISNFVVTQSEPYGTGWRVAVFHDGASTANVTIHVICSKGTGSAWVTYAQEVPAKSKVVLPLDCGPAGSVVGGGYRVGIANSPTGFNKVVMGQLYATSATKWQVEANNFGATSQIVSVMARCSAVDNHQRVTKTVTVPILSEASASVSCPAGKVATGGGWSHTAGAAYFTYGSRPDAGTNKTKWTGNFRNLNPNSAFQATVSVICVSGS